LTEVGKSGRDLSTKVKKQVLTNTALILFEMSLAASKEAARTDEYIVVPVTDDLIRQEG
jgi:hypothetical protein